MQDNAIDHRKVQDGLNFILNHFQEPLFPRKIMTKKLGYQIEVFNKEEYFKDSNYEDCRINALGAFSNPSAIVSFHLIFPSLIHLIIEERNSFTTS